mgnify:CR=1 FL=1
MKYQELSTDIIEKFNSIIEQKAFSVNFNFLFLAKEGQKQLIKISKVPPAFEFKYDVHMLVEVNEEMYDKFDDESVEILFEQQIDRIQYDFEKEKLKLVNPDFVSFSGIISKYGVEKVARANEVQDLTVKQTEDEAATA